MSDSQKIWPARGTRGFLLRSVDEDRQVRYFFRIYDAGGSFRDFDLLHFDLEVEIVDQEATFYEAVGGREGRLDHSPRTLGRDDEGV